MTARAAERIAPWRWNFDIAPTVSWSCASPAAGPAAGNVALDVRWRALDPSGGQVAAARVLRLSEPAGPGADATAAAVSRALGTLSRDIARELRTTEGWLP